MKVITWRQIPHRWQLYVLVLPSLALILTFAYFPAASAVYHAFFRWNGDDICEWVGLQNFERALHDEVLAKSFYLVGVLIVSNLLKMVPSIITAVVIHRLVSERWRYVYRVAFVIPMIIPGMVWLLIWKYFYDPTVGVLNAVLNGSGLMDVLRWLDSGSTGLPALATAIIPHRDTLVPPLFANVWGLMLVGAVLLVLRLRESSTMKGWTWLAARAVTALALGILIMGWRLGLTVVPAAMAAALILRRWRWADWGLKWAGAVVLSLASALVLTTLVWPKPTSAFTFGAPAWLGQAELLIPALIFWGFPWVGVVSVLLYLAGLANIGQDIYDAAEIDGCGWFRKFWNIELPLILTQVRLNLILMVIGTLQGWGLIFILLGDTGGPKGAGMVPGLYMFRKAFTDMEAGYAVAIGLLLFLLTLALTLINNRYVRVEK